MLHTNPLRSTDDVIAAVQNGKLVEHLHQNLELKEDWTSKYGEKLSALSNKLTQIVAFLVVGVNNRGELSLKTEKWARQTEEIISQHINSYLDPIQSCYGITCVPVGGSWILVITVKNVGEVTYWEGAAYAASGTTAQKMEPEQILKLRLQLPGLLDYSKQHIKSAYQPLLVSDFTSRVKAAGHPLEVELKGTKEHSVLLHLGINERQAARVLFGNCPVRIIRYDRDGDIVENSVQTGLFSILNDAFIQSLALQPGCNYSTKALKEALANSVAHAAYFERDGEVMLEVYTDKIVISNLCIRESSHFANRWFSRSHKTVNGLLMEALRVARVVDELGRGKHIIFSESIRLGHRAPSVIVEPAGKYMRWKLMIFGGTPDVNYLRLLRRSNEIYSESRKALIAQALVLWRDKPVTEVSTFIDDEFKEMFADVLRGFEGPIFYDQSTDKVVLRRWARVLLGEGKDSKALSEGEEQGLYETLKNFCLRHENGVVTPKLVRDFASMGNTRSEQTLSSSILARWVEKGWTEKIGHGRFRILTKSESTRSIDRLIDIFRLEPKLESS